MLAVYEHLKQIGILHLKMILKVTVQYLHLTSPNVKRRLTESSTELMNEMQVDMTFSNKSKIG